MKSKITEATNELPNFDETFRTQIEEHLNKLKSFDGKVCEEDWETLNRVLFDYTQEITDWNGTLQGGEHRLVQTAIKTAGKLHKQIEGLTDKGIDWPLSNRLTADDMSALTGSLKVLTEVEMGLPRNKGPLPGLRADAMEKAAVDLQKEVDHWYRRLTGLGPSMEDEGPSWEDEELSMDDEEKPKSHYSNFFTHVISGLDINIRPANSRTAVHDRRGYVSRSRQKEQNRLEQWRKLMSSFKKVPK